MRRLGNQHRPGRERLLGKDAAIRWGTETGHARLYVRRAAIIYQLRIGGIGHHARVLERDQYFHDVVFTQLQGKEMLADQDVVVSDAAQRVAVSASWMAPTSGCRPRRSRHLQNQPFACIVPDQRPL